MAYRYKMADLQGLVDRLNRTTGAEVKAYRQATEREKAAGFYSVANIGTYYLEGAYGGHKLVQIVNYGGGVRDVFRNGYGTKRETYRLIAAYLDGMTAQAETLAVFERAGSIEAAIREAEERSAKFQQEQEEREGVRS